MMSSETSDGVDDWALRNDSDLLDVAVQGSGLTSSLISVLPESDEGERERENSSISEYDGAGVDRRGYLDRICSGLDNGMADRSRGMKSSSSMPIISTSSTSGDGVREAYVKSR